MKKKALDFCHKILNETHKEAILKYLQQLFWALYLTKSAQGGYE